MASAKLTALLSAADPEPGAILAVASAAASSSDGNSAATTLARHAQAVALLHLERFDEALGIFSAGGSSLQTAAPFEYAYALYKTGRLAEAARIAGRLEGAAARAGLYLQAQVAYRSEDFATAARIYQELWARDGDAKDSDLRTNSGATDAQLYWNGYPDLARSKKASRDDLEAFETAYNAACACLARGELGQGEMLLKRASDLCLAADHIPDDEKQIELLSIKVQLLYVCSALGRTADAEKLAADIAIDEISDNATRQIAHINKLALQGKPANPYLAQRVFQQIPSVPKEDRLFKFQDALVRQNEIALDLLAFKFKGVASTTQRQLLQHALPTTDGAANSLSAANAAAHAQGQLGKLGLKSILPLLEKRPLDAGLALTVVQLYMLTHNHGAAIAVMQSLFKRLEEAKTDEAQDVRFAPGLIAVLVSLYNIQGRKSHIRQELAKAAKHWRHRSRPQTAFSEAAGLSLLESGKQEDLREAQEIFDALHAANAANAVANAGYVAAFAPSGPSSKVAEAAAKLAPIEKLTAGIDIAALERAGIPVPPSAAAAQLEKRKRAADAAAATDKPAKKRVRRSRLPKDYDPAKKPDPERWLPLRDRSTYKPRGKKGKQKQQALTQGGMSKEGATDSGAEASKSEVVKSSAGGGKAKKKGKKK